LISSTFNFIDISYLYCQHGISSTFNFIKISFYLYFISSTCCFIDMSFHWYVISLTCHFINMSFHQHVISSTLISVTFCYLTLSVSFPIPQFVVESTKTIRRTSKFGEITTRHFWQTFLGFCVGVKGDRNNKKVKLNPFFNPHSIP